MITWALPSNTIPSGNFMSSKSTGPRNQTNTAQISTVPLEIYQLTSEKSEQLGGHNTGPSSQGETNTMHCTVYPLSSFKRVMVNLRCQVSKSRNQTKLPCYICQKGSNIWPGLPVFIWQCVKTLYPW